MKNFIIFALIFINVLAVNAQQKLNGAIGPIAAVGYNRYTHVNWAVSYQFEKRNNDIYLVYYNPQVTVPAHASYATPQKVYTKGELGLSAWPDTELKPSSLNVQINCITPFGKTEPSGFAVSSASDGRSEDWVCSAKLNGKEVDLSAFKLVVTKASYNTQPVQDLDRIINQMKASNATAAGSVVSNTARNPTSTNGISAAQANPASAANKTESSPGYIMSYSNIGISDRAPASTKQEVTNQIISGAAGIAGNLLNDMNANRERKIAAERAAYNAKESILAGERIKVAEVQFRETYLPLIDKANRGDEHTRMLLYFTSDVFHTQSLVPQREQWLQQAYANNNTDAILEMARIAGGGYRSSMDFEKSIPLLQKAGSLGSADALFLLGQYYGTKPSSYKGIPSAGGNDPELSLKMFKAAASNGSPSAMYYLGMIYKYGYMHSYKKLAAKYNVELNEKTALEWFEKSLQPDYLESLYARTLISNNGTCSYFNKSSYYELGVLYSKGKVIPKDPAKSKLFFDNSRDYTYEYEKRQKFRQKY